MPLRPLIISFLVLGFLAACQTEDAGAPDIRPVEGKECKAADYDAWIGQHVDSLGVEAGRKLRIIPPGTMVTKDYWPDRVNVDLDDKGVVTRVWCG